MCDQCESNGPSWVVTVYHLADEDTGLEGGSCSGHTFPVPLPRDILIKGYVKSIAAVTPDHFLAIDQRFSTDEYMVCHEVSSPTLTKLAETGQETAEVEPDQDDMEYHKVVLFHPPEITGQAIHDRCHTMMFEDQFADG